MEELKVVIRIKLTAPQREAIRKATGKNAEALAALATAEKLDPSFDMTYVYRAGVRMSEQNVNAAVDEFRRALALNPRNQMARQALAMIDAQRNVVRQ